LTDGAAGGIMARAAAQIAALNVRVNATALKDQELAAKWQEELAAIEQSIDSMTNEIQEIAAERGGF